MLTMFQGRPRIVRQHKLDFMREMGWVRQGKSETGDGERLAGGMN